MSNFEETVSALKCSDSYRLDLASLVTALRPALLDIGCTVSAVEQVEDDEVVLYLGDSILSICFTGDSAHDLLVAAETPKDADDHGIAMRRKLLCVTATRVLCEHLHVSSISWSHEGAFYVTDTERRFSRIESCKKSVAAAVATVAEGLVCGADEAVRRNMRRFFPSDSDVVLAQNSRN